jgi:hypothetical protein
MDSPRREGNGMAVASMVLGILAVVLFFTSLIDIVIALLAIIFAIIGLKRAKRVGAGKGMAIVGLATGIVGMVLAVVLVAAIAIPAFTEYMKGSKSREASLQLGKLGDNAKVYYLQNGAFPTGTIGPTPVRDCCDQPGGRCALYSGDWQAPLWKQLDFRLDQPSLYRYSYQSDGKWFVAKATGDTDCDGQHAVFELDGTIGPGGEVTTNLIKPFGVY